MVVADIRSRLDVDDQIPPGSLWKFERNFVWTPHHGNEKPIVFLAAYLIKNSQQNVRYPSLEPDDYWIEIQYLLTGEDKPRWAKYCELPNPHEVEKTFLCNWSLEWCRMDAL